MHAQLHAMTHTTSDTHSKLLERTESCYWQNQLPKNVETSERAHQMETIAQERQVQKTTLVAMVRGYHPTG
eukprot:4851273-Amphidinium_carterae.1